MEAALEKLRITNDRTGGTRGEDDSRAKANEIFATLVEFIGLARTNFLHNFQVYLQPDTPSSAMILFAIVIGWPRPATKSPAATEEL